MFLNDNICLLFHFSASACKYFILIFFLQNTWTQRKYSFLGLLFFLSWRKADIFQNGNYLKEVTMNCIVFLFHRWGDTPALVFCSVGYFCLESLVFHRQIPQLIVIPCYQTMKLNHRHLHHHILLLYLLITLSQEMKSKVNNLNDIKSLSVSSRITNLHKNSSIFLSV